MSGEANDLDDLLKRATNALRDETGAPNPRSGLTRARMLDNAEKRYASAPRRPWLRWLVPVTGVFLVGTALAQRAPDYWPALREVLRPVLDLPPAKPPRRAPARSVPAPVSPPSAAGAGAPAPAPVEEPSNSVEVPSAEPAAPRADAPVERLESPGVGRGRVKPRRAPSASSPIPAPPAEPQAGEPAKPAAPAPRSAELELFRRAQSLHDARDPGAVAAWDAYLRVVDRGVLVPEARYNRALCLIRLGRTREARAALTPFARGDYGSYRREEAAALLAELR